MWGRIVLGVIVASLAGVAVAQQPNQPQRQPTCMSTFFENVSACVHNNSINYKNFLYIMTNTSNGEQAQDPQAFKHDLCGKRRPLIQCGINFMRQLMSGSLCGPSPTNRQDQRGIIDKEFHALFDRVDAMCAHPCRKTLTKDLRQCYDDSGLDPELFLSNATMGRGAVIGTTIEQVGTFCKHREQLIGCMKQKRDECPESPMILRVIGLDIDSMEKGVGVLCNHPDVYLSGIGCFDKPTNDVKDCGNNQSDSTMKLMMTARQNKFTQDQYFDQFCKIRMKHVHCDLGAWARKRSKFCNSIVIGLRTELECTLIPDQCHDREKASIAEVCHVDKFKKNPRNEYGGGSAGSVSVTWSELVALLIFSVILTR